MKLNELSNYLYLFGNDCRTLHLHAIGDEFENLHNYLQDLYEISFDFYDFACESAIAHNEEIVNPTLIYENLKNEWNPIVGDSFDKQTIISYVRENGTYIMNCIQQLDEYESWVQSKVDSYSEDFDKIINYKFLQMNK